MNIQLRIEQIKLRQQDKDRQGKIGRRNIGTGKIAYLIACLVTSVLGLVSFSFSVQAHTDLTVVNWGGDAARAQMLALVRPFEQATGKRVNMDHYSGDLQVIRDQVDAENVKWDVLDLEYSDLIRLCAEGYLEPIDHSYLSVGADGTQPEQDFITDSLPECGVGSIIWATVYAYSQASFPVTQPRTIADFFDVQRFPGKRGLRRDPRGALEWALMADGVPADRVYQILDTTEGLDRAFAVLDTIRDQIVWWSGGAEPVRLLSSGEVSMSAAWNGRLFRPILESGLPISIVWDAQLWEIELWGIAKGTPRLAAAKQFIRFATDTTRLVDHTRYISYGPVRQSAMARIPDELLQHLPTSAQNQQNALRYNSVWWADRFDMINSRFTAWLEAASQAADRARF